ncbi:hypothetical protein F503_07708 [Ophiostoma piceae UAMH 11346]|uniref:Inheritance of peroxisomes protein 1 n=1 Tax=Ophiostoma piceae (strain UAMH 11346) TaxID=1262450 RepID=S3CRW3_OPHP1|nr:hypothetical protein F503_07708 [Ophiostoma piceae UAMH 11346]
MGAARAAGHDAAAPTPPRRAYTAPLAPRAPVSIRGSSNGHRDHADHRDYRDHSDYRDYRSHRERPTDPNDPRNVLAAAAAEAAAAAADFGTSPKSDVSSVAGSNVGSAVGSAVGSNVGSNIGSYMPPSAANGEAIETLYTHPAVKILSFNAGPRINLDNIGSSASRAAAGRNRRSTSTAGIEDDIPPGTLAWSSQFDRTIAIGALSIYRAPGSVAFLSCGSALQPILPKSQCWCIDEESSKFILQIRRPQYWRIEVPVGDDGENDERAHRLREVLEHILQFEKTPCPFKRDFTVELPEQQTPLKKKPWTPVKRPDSDVSLAGPAHPKLQTPQPHPERQVTSPAPLPEEGEDEPVSLTPAPRKPHGQEPPSAQRTEFTRKEWLAMLEAEKKKGNDHPLDEFGRKLVPTLVAEHEQRISDLKASEIEVNKMGVPWHDNGTGMPHPGGEGESKPRRERTMSLTSDVPTSTRAAWPSIDGRWHEESDQSTTADSNSPFNSLRSWLSSSKTVTSATSPPSSTGDDVPPSLTSLYTNNDQQQPPRTRHRATTSSISVSNRAGLQPAVNIIAPAHLRNINVSGRVSGGATTRMEAMQLIPGSIMYRVLEMLLAPPAYLMSLMLKIAARILKGEWRGSALGTNTDTGENISAQWDYSDVVDPFGRRGAALRRSGSTKRADKPTSYTEADVDVYTDDENGDSDEDDGNTARCFSSSSKTRAGNETETLSDVGGDPIVYRRRWNVD